MKLRKKFIVTVISLAVFVTGCGIGKKQENIDQGMAAIENMDYEGALTCFEKALVEGEDAELVYRGRGIAYIGLTQYEDAAAALEKSLSYCNGILSGLEFDINYYLALAYYKNGDVGRALDVYNAILDLREDEKTAYYLRGTLELEQDDFERADADFQKALALDQTDYDCLFDIYRSMENNGYREAGAEYLQTALEAGEDKISDYDKGRLYYYLEDYDNAKNCLEKARDTGSAQVALFLGRTYEELGDFNYASSVYLNYLDKDPSSAEIQNQLGICRMQMNEYEGALEAFEAGLACEDDSCEQTLKFNQIAACEKLARFDQAASLTEEYLKLYPDDERAKREYEFLKTR